MQKVFILVFLIVLSSCNYFERQKLNADDIVKERLKTFSWDNVDTFPTFSHCDTLIDKALSKSCFQKTIVNHVYNNLKSQDFVVSTYINDTIKLQLKVNKKGETFIDTITIKPQTLNEIPKIDSLLRQSIASLPKLYPAIKQGRQVDSKFTLPIVINIK